MPAKTPSNFIDLTGQRFGRLVVLKRDFDVPESKKWRVRWICVCDCGNRKSVEGSVLKSGGCLSCTCLRKELRRKRLQTHGLSETPEYGIWGAIKSRCYNKNTINYCNYGARGVTMCDRWKHSFENFIQDMGKRPSKFHSIERIDNNKGYSPDNCKWATRIEQNNNTRPRKVDPNRGIRYCKQTKFWYANLGERYEKHFKKEEDARIARALFCKQRNKEIESCLMIAKNEPSERN